MVKSVAQRGSFRAVAVSARELETQGVQPVPAFRKLSTQRWSCPVELPVMTEMVQPTLSHGSH